MILEVALPVPVPKTFDYLGPIENSPGHSPVGCRVKVLFGFRPLTGVVVAEKSTSNSPADKLKPVLKFLDEEPVFNAQQIEFARWLAHRYVCSVGEVLNAMLPPGKNPKDAPKDSHENHHALFLNTSGFQLTDDQQSAVNKVHEAIYSNAGPKAFLLRGVAAAGKTEVYLAAIKDALAQGRSALYLVPEIGLCAQTAEILKQRFGEKNVCVYHSDVLPSERFENWWKIKRGLWPIIVGARSAALLPVLDPGIIIVDEEQDMAYKEDRKPRFHARDVALERARQSNAVVIFGSAVPSLELFQQTREGVVQLIEMEERAVQASTPNVCLINTKAEKTFGSSLSPSLLSAIGERLKKNEQTILFLNRRGFHRYLKCPHCDWMARCEKCGVTLVEHKIRDTKYEIRSKDSEKKLIRNSYLVSRNSNLVCHYCAHTYPLPSTCPECGQKKLFAGGTGTQRVEEEIKEKFPWVRVARWDRDSAKKRGTQEQIFKQFRNGEIDVLVGTQLVAQGFNFPKVTLVGVVDADAPLHIPDFRAAEHAYQLLTQVAGRAGRELVTGEVLIQTREPEHYAIAAAARMDFSGFAEQELRFRDDLNYPPFSHLVRIQTSSKQAAKAEKDIESVTQWASELNLGEAVGILGPSKSRRKKKRGSPISSFA